MPKIKHLIYSAIYSIILSSVYLLFSIISIILYDTVNSTESYIHIKSVLLLNYVIFIIVPASIVLLKKIDHKFKLAIIILLLPTIIFLLGSFLNEFNYNCYGAGRFEKSIFTGPFCPQEKKYWESY